PVTPGRRVSRARTTATSPAPRPSRRYTIISTLDSNLRARWSRVLATTVAAPSATRVTMVIVTAAALASPLCPNPRIPSLTKYSRLRAGRNRRAAGTRRPPPGLPAAGIESPRLIADHRPPVERDDPFPQDVDDLLVVRGHDHGGAPQVDPGEELHDLP